VIGYFVCVLAGLVVAALASRWQGDVVGLPDGVRARLLLAAVLGAIVGAFLLQLPADLCGWSAPPPPGMRGDGMPLGGRTVLGGLLGGWLAVEVAKHRLGVRLPTGDGFALPLALALGCGRLGCMFAGCCAGESCGTWWGAYVDALGTPRVPVQAIEAALHFAMAAWIWLAMRRGWQRGRRLAIYVTLLAAVRFTLEFWRQHPRVLLGLDWYQLLAAALLLLAGSTWRRRAAIYRASDGR